MQIGMIGLGRMGANLVRRLLRYGHHAVVYDANPDAMGALAADGAHGTDGLEALVAALPPPRAVWVMLPAGAPTEDAIAALGRLLEAGDLVIDGGNTFYKDDVRRAEALAARGIGYLDVGTSGGVHGRERGYCLMIGGPEDAVQRLDPIFAALAPGAGETPGTPDTAGDTRPLRGYAHVGPAGAGHYAKMVHNGIEYGMMQAMAEGLHLLHAKRDAAHIPYDIDVAALAQAWRRGSVISSWLLDLAAEALAADGELAAYTGAVGDSGEGRWTVDAAVEHGVPAPVLAAALFARFRSQHEDSYADRVLSALRHGFGGHGLGERR